MKRGIFWTALATLVILHHDWWFWDDGTLLLGFLPIGLGYHALLSLAAGGFWAWAAYFTLTEFLADDEVELVSEQMSQDTP